MADCERCGYREEGLWSQVEPHLQFIWRISLATIEKFVRRYTDIPALIHLLTEKQITLLDPDTWDDKNDSYFLRLLCAIPDCSELRIVRSTLISNDEWKHFGDSAVNRSPERF
jgi:hypothetical protein